MKYFAITVIAAAALVFGARSVLAEDSMPTSPAQNMCIIGCATDEAQCREACGEDEGCKELCSTDAKQCAAACVSE